ncbi:MAG: hypothetical protein AAF085_10890, partial [Planctomycetota bacterium]
TLGKEVDGVKIPGSTSFQAAYLDQALTLLPLAEEIHKDGTDVQKESANAIIGSIRTDEASFLIDEAELSLQAGVNNVIALREKISVLRDIEALKESVAGDRSEVVRTYQTGLDTAGATINGIDQLQQAANGVAGQADEAEKNFGEFNAQIDDLREKVAEYEELELKLIGQARSSQAGAKFDKLDQATTAAVEAETAQSQAEKFEIDAWIAERVAGLAEFKRQQLAGDKQSSTAQLIGKLGEFLSASSTETNVPTSSDTYAALAQALEQAKSASGDDVLQAAAFMTSMSAYSTAGAADSDQRGLLVAAMDKRITDYLGLIGSLEMKIAQIKLERQRVADRLAEIEADKGRVIQEITEDFAEYDKTLQVAGFDRTAAALDSLELAETAVKGSGKDTEMELMGVYLITARALHQQSLSAQLYAATLDAMVEVGPELLGNDLHDTLSERSRSMQGLLADVKAKIGDLQTAADLPATKLANIDPESDRGVITTRQKEVYDSLMTSLGTAPAGDPSAGTTPPAGDDTTTEPPAADGGDPSPDN